MGADSSSMVLARAGPEVTRILPSSAIGRFSTPMLPVTAWTLGKLVTMTGVTVGSGLDVSSSACTAGWAVVVAAIAHGYQRPNARTASFRMNSPLQKCDRYTTNRPLGE